VNKAATTVNFFINVPRVRSRRASTSPSPEQAPVAA
jgi:hypothetical protein